MDGILVICAGALLLTPGFLTDLTGLALLLPPVRALVRAGVVRRFRSRPPRVSARFVRFGSFIDVDVDDVGGSRRPPEPPRKDPELGR